MNIVDEVGISNMGLDFLKAKPATNIRDPKTPEETICARWYDTSRRQVLRAHPWNFAKARAILSRNATAPIFGYPDKYALPNDFLRLRFIDEETETLVGKDYQIEGGFILIDEGGASSINIGYIKDETVVNKWDELCKRYVAAQMAYNMAYSFTGKESTRTAMANMLHDIRLEARAVNGQDNPPRRVTRSKVIGARRAYASGGVNRADPTIVPGT
jgi:hypothetical protein